MRLSWYLAGFFASLLLLGMSPATGGTTKMLRFDQMLSISRCVGNCEKSSLDQQTSWRFIVSRDAWSSTEVKSGITLIGNYIQGTQFNVYDLKKEYSSDSMERYQRVHSYAATWFPLPGIKGVTTVAERTLGSENRGGNEMVNLEYTLDVDEGSRSNPTAHDTVVLDVESLADSTVCNDGLRGAFVSPVVADCNADPDSKLGFIVSATAVYKKSKVVLKMRRKNISESPFDERALSVPIGYSRLGG